MKSVAEWEPNRGFGFRFWSEVWELDGALSSSNHSQDEVLNFDDKKRGQALLQTDTDARGTA